MPHLLVLLSALALYPACFSQSSTAPKPAAHSDTIAPHDRQLLQQAASAEDGGHLAEAAATLRDLEKRYPANFDVVEEYGLVLAESGRLDDALPLLERAARLRPSSSAAWANLGAAELKRQQASNAASAYRKAVQLEPGNAQNQEALGAALMQAGNPGEAARAFAAAAAITPADPDLLFNWSVALLDAGDTAKSAEVAGRIPNPEASAQVQLLLGDLAERQNNFKQAVEHYQAAANLDPSEANLYALAMEFVRHWTFEPALKIFEYGLSRYPSSERLLSGQGIAKYANNNYAESAQIFSDLLARQPENVLYAQILGRSCNLVPDSTKACDTLVDFAQRHPSNAEADTYAAATILHRPGNGGDLSLAEQLLKRAIAADPKLADAYYQLGMLKQQQDQWDQSKDALERSVALNPKLSKAHYRLALAYSHTGDKDRSREQLALYQKLEQQQKEEANTRLEEVTTFLVSNK